MPGHVLQRVQRIPASIDVVWDFFSNPSNLSLITPPEMDFRILTKDIPAHIANGQLIDYMVRPLWSLRVRWRTAIRDVKEKEFFVDVQQRGPYRSWEHHHFFREIEGGVEMTDVVHYQNPFGWFGHLANRVVVARKLKSIFDYRRKKIVELFGPWNGD